MTAINVIVNEKEVVVVTDTRARSAIGQDFETAKAMPIPHLRLVVATRGNADMLGKVAMVVGAASFDYDSARVFLSDNFASLGFGDTEVIVAGWSANGPAAFIVSAANTDGKVIDIEHGLVTPVVPQDVFNRFNNAPEAHLVETMQRQADANSSVGGWINVYQVDHATIGCYTSDRLYSPEIRAPLAA